MINIFDHYHDDSRAVTSKAFEEEFWREGITDTEREPCPCQNREIRNLGKMALIHPHSGFEGSPEDCYESCRDLIQRNPGTHFYIIALAFPKRKEIGEFPNADYVAYDTEHTMDTVLREAKSLIE
jgi:hypothetical protein